MYFGSPSFAITVGDHAEGYKSGFQNWQNCVPLVFSTGTFWECANAKEYLDVWALNDKLCRIQVPQFCLLEQHAGQIASVTDFCEKIWHCEFVFYTFVCWDMFLSTVQVQSWPRHITRACAKGGRTMWSFSSHSGQFCMNVCMHSSWPGSSDCMLLSIVTIKRLY
jgi:hypothetical protein